MRVASSGHAITCCSSSLSLYVAVVVAESKKKINLVKKTHSNEKKTYQRPRRCELHRLGIYLLPPPIGHCRCRCTSPWWLQLAESKKRINLVKKHVVDI